MASLPPFRTMLVTALVLTTFTGTARAQQSYPQTLYWGSGLIDIPVAWVSPMSGDFAISYSAKHFTNAPGSLALDLDDGLNSNLSIGTSLFGRAELGVAIFSDNPEWGLYGRVLLLNEEHFRDRPGAARWIPSVAVGVRNVGPYGKVDRFTIGYNLVPDTVNGGFTHEADSLHEGFETSETVYGVVTKSFSLRDVSASWPNVDVSFSAGYGNGLFRDDGGLGDIYAKRESGGVFGGVRMALHPGRNTVVSLMVEHNAWDYNLGATVDWRGLVAGLYWTEVGAGQQEGTGYTDVLYNYNKVAFTLGWQSNAVGLVRGDFLRGRLAELERRRDLLQREIAGRQQRIAQIELEINRYEAQNLLELEQRRAQAEAELRAEREALRRLEDRLRRLEQTTPPSQRTPE